MNRIQLAASLYDTRDTMRRFWGEKFKDKIDMYQEAIQREAKFQESDLLAATLKVAQRVQKGFPDFPMMMALCIAAGVELIEPTDTPPSGKEASRTMTKQPSEAQCIASQLRCIAEALRKPEFKAAGWASDLDSAAVELERLSEYAEAALAKTADTETK